MKKANMITRREFVQLGAAFGMLAGLGQLNLGSAANASLPLTDYKALVCLFMFGGNDGHNMVVPLGNPQYAAYQAARGALALPPNQLLGINDAVQGQFGLHYAMPELQTLYNQGHMAVMANVGMLVKPTYFSDLSNSSFPLPLNLRSHADQVVEMQMGDPTAGGNSGWGGRTLDQMQNNNAGTNFPVSISMNSPALFCTGGVVQGTSLQPGNYFDQGALSVYPPAAAQARAAAQQQIIAGNSGNSIINAANAVLGNALALNPLLKNAASAINFNKPFPQTGIGDQLKEIARIISLNSQLGVGRQVFFCSLGGFDTHGGQSYQQWDLLQQVSKALDAFYAATVQLQVADQVTAFTLSDFGRTLQPSGTGSDHGWGNHHLILGGAVNGGKMYGTYPLMTNYANFNASNSDYADNRGVMLPNTSLAQYGATMAKWFGALDLLSVFPNLQYYAGQEDLGFMG